MTPDEARVLALTKFCAKVGSARVGQEGTGFKRIAESVSRCFLAEAQVDDS